MDSETVEFRDLSLWKDNYRHRPMGSDAEIVTWFVSAYEDQIYQLAKDIIEEGILDPLVVLKEGDTFTIYDGNRRGVVLKLLSNPDLGSTTKTKDRFKSLKNDNKDAIGKLLDNLTVLIYEDESEIKKLIHRRHTGADGGIGTLEWSREAKENERKDMGGQLLYPRAGAIKKYLEHKNLFTGIQESMDKVLTSWDRYLSFLNDYFSVNKNIVQVAISEDDLGDLLTKIHDMMTDKKIIASEKRETFMDKLGEEFTTLEKTDPWQPIGSDLTSKEVDTPPSPRKKKRPEVVRKTIIEKNTLELPNNASFITKGFFKELSKSSILDSTKAPYVTGPAVRVLLESIFEQATKTKGQGLNKSYTEAIKMYGEENPKDKKYANALDSGTINKTIRLLHTASHAVEYQQSFTDLCQLWDNQLTLIKFCFRKIEEQGKEC